MTVSVNVVLFPALQSDGKILCHVLASVQLCVLVSEKPLHTGGEVWENQHVE